MNQIPNQGAPIPIPMNTLFQLDAMASMLIDAFKTGNNIPNAQKAKLFGNRYYWNALEFPESIPSPMLKRFHLVYLFNILDEKLLENSINVLNDAYRIFKFIDYPPELEYSDEFLSLLVDFKTMLFIRNMMISTYQFDKLLQHFVQNLQVYIADNPKAQIVNNKWIAKCKKRRKEISQQFGSVDNLCQVFPVSEFLEKIKSFLMITGDYVNQKFPVKTVRDIMNGKREGLESTSSVKSSTVESVSTVPQEDNRATRVSPRKLPQSLSKDSTPKRGIHENVATQKRSADTMNINRDENSSSGVNTVNLTSEVVDLPRTRKAIAAAATSTNDINGVSHSVRDDVGKLEQIFSTVNSHHLDDLNGLKKIKESASEHADGALNQIISGIKEKRDILYKGCSLIKKYMSDLKECQIELENISKPKNYSNNELPWTDDEEEVEVEILNSEIEQDETSQRLRSFSGSNLDNSDPYDLQSDFPESKSYRSRKKARKLEKNMAQPYEAKIRKALYRTTNVYEMDYKTGLVLRRCSDGWVNASTILNASTKDKSLINRIESEVPQPFEIVKGSKQGRLQGVWVPIETAREVSRLCDAENELSPLFAVDFSSNK